MRFMTILFFVLPLMAQSADQQLTREIFKQVAPRITTRSETFRLVSEGVVTSTGARHRIQAVVHVGSQAVETLSYREDL